MNSPVKPIFDLAASRIQESGTIDYLLKKWEGREIPFSTGTCRHRTFQLSC